MAQEKLDIWTVRFFNAIDLYAALGAFKSLGSSIRSLLFDPVIETQDAEDKRHPKQKVFIKFMSDKGELDFEQGNAFEEWLKFHRVPYERTANRAGCKRDKVEYMQEDDRKFIVPVLALEKALGFPLPSDLWGGIEELDPLSDRLTAPKQLSGNAFLLGVEYGYKQAEDGKNLDAALDNAKKEWAGVRSTTPRKNGKAFARYVAIPAAPKKKGARRARSRNR